MIDKVLTALRAYWPKLPRDIRMALVMAIVSAITAFVVLAWRDGYRPAGMDKLLTRQASSEQLDTLRSHLEAGRDQAIQAALAQYDAAIREYLANERELGTDTLVRPAIKMLFDLDARMRTMERAVKVTNAKMDQMPTAYEERLRKLLDDNRQQDRTADMLDLVLKRMSEQEQAAQLMMESIEELRQGRRVSKQKF